MKETKNSINMQKLTMLSPKEEYYEANIPKSYSKFQKKQANNYDLKDHDELQTYNQSN